MAISYRYKTWLAGGLDFFRLPYDLLADIPKSHQDLVLGGEVHMWAEQTDGMNLENNLWPRAADAEEILWRGKGQVSEDVKRRLAMTRELLNVKGILATPVQVTGV